MGFGPFSTSLENRAGVYDAEALDFPPRLEHSEMGRTTEEGVTTLGFDVEFTSLAEACFRLRPSACGNSSSLITSPPLQEIVDDFRSGVLKDLS